MKKSDYTWQNSVLETCPNQFKTFNKVSNNLFYNKSYNKFINNFWRIYDPRKDTDLKSIFVCEREVSCYREPGWRGGGLDTEIKVGISDNPDFRQLVSL